MGSAGMFSPAECDLCHGFTIEPSYPQIWICEDCEVRRRSYLFLLLWKIDFGVGLEEHFYMHVLDFIVVKADRQLAARKKHLLHALLARDSVFCQFTHFSGGLKGNISDTEDIIDRILVYVAASAELDDVSVSIKMIDVKYNAAVLFPTKKNKARWLAFAGENTLALQKWLQVTSLLPYATRHAQVLVKARTSLLPHQPLALEDIGGVSII